MPTVSIVVPIYKVEQYIHRCIDSILSQTFSDFELILVDDGSPDNCGAICNEYAEKDPRVKVIHKPNGGVSSARNAGIDAAIGKYIAFCDSDDYLDPEWVAELVGAISKAPTAWCFCGCHCVDANGSRFQENCVLHKTPAYETLPMKAYPEIYKTNFSACLWLRIFNLDIIRTHDIRFDENLSVSEDVLFTLEYGAYCDSFSVINRALYNHRMYLNNESEHLDGKLPKEMFYLNEKIYAARKPLIPATDKQRFETDFFYRFLNDIKTVCHSAINTNARNEKLRSIVRSKSFHSCIQNADTSKENWKLLLALRLKFCPLIYRLFRR